MLRCFCRVPCTSGMRSLRNGIGIPGWKYTPSFITPPYVLFVHIESHQINISQPPSGCIFMFWIVIMRIHRSPGMFKTLCHIVYRTRKTPESEHWENWIHQLSFIFVIHNTYASFIKSSTNDHQPTEPAFASGPLAARHPDGACLDSFEKHGQRDGYFEIFDWYSSPSAAS